MTRAPKKRGRAPLPEAERKDRLVQARVPENLDETLREEARRNRVSVSQLIRNVLEDTFTLVDDVVAQTTSLSKQVKRDALRIADSAKGRRPPAAAAVTAVPAVASAGADEANAVAPAPLPTLSPRAQAALAAVYAWQEVVLNRDTDCARCGREMDRGDKAHLGLQDDPGAKRLWLCAACVAAL